MSDASAELERATAPPGQDAFDLDEALHRAIRGGAKITDAHLRLIERDVIIGETRTTLHCYCLPLDGNGRVRFKPLAEFLRNRIVDYAIPRVRLEEARQEFNETGSAAAILKLQARARELFTDLAQTGEGGELMLFAMAEAVFGLTQVVCKMSLKTSRSMHVDFRRELTRDWAVFPLRSDPCLNPPLLVDRRGFWSDRHGVTERYPTLASA